MENISQTVPLKIAEKNSTITHTCALFSLLNVVTTDAYKSIYNFWKFFYLKDRKNLPEVMLLLSKKVFPCVWHRS